MAITFPSTLDALTNPVAGTHNLSSVAVPHATQHADLNDAIEALEAKVGIDGSGVSTSLDKKVTDLTTNAILKTLVDVKGDLLAASGADTLVRLPVGADGTHLMANSAMSSGLEWTPDFMTEDAQDAVGTILVDSSRIDFTYTDATPAITADIVASSIGTTQLANQAVNFAKFQNIATSRLVGRQTASAGSIEELTVGGGLEFTTGGIRHALLTGAVTQSTNGGATSIATDAITATQLANNAVDTAAIATNAVDFTKFQTITTQRILGRQTAATGNVEQLTVGGGLEWVTGGIQRALISGDVTVTAGTTVATIPNDTITYAKMQNVSQTDVLLGRDTAGAGDVEEILPAAARTLLDVPQNSAAVLKSIVTTKGDILAAAASANIVRKAVGANDTILMAASANADGLKWATPLEVRTAIGLPATYAANVGDGSTTAITVTHSLATYDVVVEVYRNSGSRDTIPGVEVQRSSTNAVVLGFDVAPSAAEFRVVVRA